MLYTASQTTDCLTRPYRHLLVSLDDHVLTLMLNRPEKKNALNPTLLNELAFAIAFAQHEPTVWLVVLSATGDVFCAGMDLKTLAAGSTESETVPLPAGPVRLGELMSSLHKPSIARVQGPVLAGGFLLIAPATYVIAADTATFSLPEVKRGLFPFQVLALLLNLMPARPALDLCLRGRTLTASEAWQLGLVTSVVAATELDQAVLELTGELKQYSPTAMQFGLRAYQQLKSLPPNEQQAYLFEQFQQLQQTPDAKEGMAAFLEKRQPRWSE